MKKQIEVLARKIVKTMAQAALGVIGTSAAIGEVDWLYLASVSALAGLVCFFMNLADLKTGEEE